jgi:hypothetical protein
MKLLTFDTYDEYKRVQVEANKLKYDDVFAEDPELGRLAEHFRSRHSAAGVGLCHGVRNGYEVRKLRALLPGLDIIGTDISETAQHVPNCIVWDMHDLKPEWVGAIHLIYSNSWDHTYDPRLLFKAWSESLAPDGRLYLSYTPLHSEKGVSAQSKVDVFGCSLTELVDLAKETLDVEEILDVRPRLTLQAWRRRMTYLRSGRYARALTARLMSRPVQVVALRHRTG